MSGLQLKRGFFRHPAKSHSSGLRTGKLTRPTLLLQALEPIQAAMEFAIMHRLIRHHLVKDPWQSIVIFKPALRIRARSQAFGVSRFWRFARRPSSGFSGHARAEIRLHCL
jgi:hypothetical protein